MGLTNSKKHPCARNSCNQNSNQYFKSSSNSFRVSNCSSARRFNSSPFQYMQYPQYCEYGAYNFNQNCQRKRKNPGPDLEDIINYFRNLKKNFKAKKKDQAPQSTISPESKSETVPSNERIIPYPSEPESDTKSKPILKPQDNTNEETNNDLETNEKTKNDDRKGFIYKFRNFVYRIKSLFDNESSDKKDRKKVLDSTNIRPEPKTSEILADILIPDEVESGSPLESENTTKSKFSNEACKLSNAIQFKSSAYVESCRVCLTNLDGTKYIENLKPSATLEAETNLTKTYFHHEALINAMRTAPTNGSILNSNAKAQTRISIFDSNQPSKSIIKMPNSKIPTKTASKLIAEIKIPNEYNCEMPIEKTDSRNYSRPNSMVNFYDANQPIKPKIKTPNQTASELLVEIKIPNEYNCEMPIEKPTNVIYAQKCMNEDITTPKFSPNNNQNILNNNFIAQNTQDGFSVVQPPQSTNFSNNSSLTFAQASMPSVCCCDVTIQSMGPSFAAQNLSTQNTADKFHASSDATVSTNRTPKLLAKVIIPSDCCHETPILMGTPDYSNQVSEEDIAIDEKYTHHEKKFVSNNIQVHSMTNDEQQTYISQPMRNKPSFLSRSTNRMRNRPRVSEHCSHYACSDNCCGEEGKKRKAQGDQKDKRESQLKNLCTSFGGCFESLRRSREKTKERKRQRRNNRGVCKGNCKCQSSQTTGEINDEKNKRQNKDSVSLEKPEMSTKRKSVNAKTQTTDTTRKSYQSGGSQSEDNKDIDRRKSLNQRRSSRKSEHENSKEKDKRPTLLVGNFSKPIEQAELKQNDDNENSEKKRGSKEERVSKSREDSNEKLTENINSNDRENLKQESDTKKEEADKDGSHSRIEALNNKQDSKEKKDTSKEIEHKNGSNISFETAVETELKSTNLNAKQETQDDNETEILKDKKDETNEADKLNEPSSTKRKSENKYSQTIDETDNSLKNENVQSKEKSNISQKDEKTPQKEKSIEGLQSEHFKSMERMNETDIDNKSNKSVDKKKSMERRSGSSRFSFLRKSGQRDSKNETIKEESHAKIKEESTVQPQSNSRESHKSKRNSKTQILYHVQHEFDFITKSGQGELFKSLENKNNDSDLKSENNIYKSDLRTKSLPQSFIVLGVSGEKIVPDTVKTYKIDNNKPKSISYASKPFTDFDKNYREKMYAKHKQAYDKIFQESSYLNKINEELAKEKYKSKYHAKDHRKKKKDSIFSSFDDELDLNKDYRKKRHKKYKKCSSFDDTSDTSSDGSDKAHHRKRYSKKRDETETSSSEEDSDDHISANRKRYLYYIKEQIKSDITTDSSSSDEEDRKEYRLKNKEEIVRITCLYPVNKPIHDCQPSCSHNCPHSGNPCYQCQPITYPCTGSFCLLGQSNDLSTNKAHEAKYSKKHEEKKQKKKNNKKEHKKGKKS